MSTEALFKAVQAINDAQTVIAVMQPILNSAVLQGRKPTDAEVDAALAEVDAKSAALKQQIAAARAAEG